MVIDCRYKSCGNVRFPVDRTNNRDGLLGSDRHVQSLQGGCIGAPRLIPSSKVPCQTSLAAPEATGLSYCKDLLTDSQPTTGTKHTKTWSGNLMAVGLPSRYPGCRSEGLNSGHTATNDLSNSYRIIRSDMGSPLPTPSVRMGKPRG